MNNSLLTSIFGFDRKQLRGITSIRCGLGLTLPLVGFWWMGHLAWGILAGLGAIYAGLASFNGVYQARLRYMVATTVLMTLVTILGTLVSSNVWLSIAAVTVVGFLLSLYAAMRPAANLLATLATGTLVILSKVLQTAGEPFHLALGNGLLILSGGASEILLLTLFWPFTQHYPERQAIARVYESLSEFATQLARGHKLQMLEGETIQEARDLMDALDRYKLKPEQVGLRRALSTAEGIRASLVGLTSTPASELPRIAAYLFYLSARLGEVADRILAKQILEIPPSPDVSFPEGISDETGGSLTVIHALLDHLQEPILEATGPRKTMADWTHHLSFRLIALESSPSLRSIACRHAIRYALALCIATSLSRLGSFGNGYWIPLTVCMVLRSDYASTLKTGVARAFGTILGVLVGLVLAYLAKGSVPAHVAIVLLSSFGFYFFFRANYALFTAMVTVWVIFSITASGLPEKLVGGQRLEATLIGIAMAVIAYRLLPSWQSTRVREVLRDAAESQIEFCERVLLQPQMPSRVAWERELDKARALRYEAEAVVESAVKEPVWRKNSTAPLVHEILVELEMNAAQLLGLLAQRLASPEHSPTMDAKSHRVSERAKSLISRLGQDPHQSISST